MNPFEEWLKILAGVLGNLAFLFLSLAFVEPLFKGADIFDVNPLLFVYGVCGAGISLLAALIVLHWSK